MTYFKKSFFIFFSSKTLSLLALLPFLFSFVYLWRWPIKNWGTINCLDFLLAFFILYSWLFLLKKRSFSSFISFCQENRFLFFSLLLFLLFSFFTGLKSPYFWDSLGLWKSFFFLPIIFAWFLAFWQQQGFFKESCFLNVIWLSACVLALGSVYFWLTNRLSFDQRLSFIFSSPNQLALTLSPALFIGLMKLKNTWRKTEKTPLYLTLLGLFLIIFSLWQTQSLGAWLFLPTTLFFTNLFYQKKALFKPFLVFFLIFNLFLLLNWSFLLKTFRHQPQKPPNSIDSRITIWQVTEKILSNNWLKGLGLGNFQSSYLAYQQYFPPYPQWAVPHAHNLFFQLWVELGFLPFVFFFFCLWSFFSFQEKNDRNNRLFLNLLLYFLLYGLIEPTFWKNDLALIFWYILLGGQINSEKPTTNSVHEEESLFCFIKK